MPNVDQMLAAMRQFNARVEPNAPADRADSSSKIGSFILAHLPLGLRVDIKRRGPAILAAKAAYQQARVQYPEHPAIANMHLRRAANEVRSILRGSLTDGLDETHKVTTAIGSLLRPRLPRASLGWQAATDTGTDWSGRLRNGWSQIEGAADSTAQILFGPSLMPTAHLAIQGVGRARVRYPEQRDLPTPTRRPPQPQPAPEKPAAPAARSPRVPDNLPHDIPSLSHRAWTGKHSEPWLVRPRRAPYRRPEPSHGLRARAAHIDYTVRTSRATNAWNKAASAVTSRIPTLLSPQFWFTLVLAATDRSPRVHTPQHRPIGRPIVRHTEATPAPHTVRQGARSLNIRQQLASRVVSEPRWDPYRPAVAKRRPQVPQVVNRAPAPPYTVQPAAAAPATKHTLASPWRRTNPYITRVLPVLSHTGTIRHRPGLAQPPNTFASYHFRYEFMTPEGERKTAVVSGPTPEAALGAGRKWARSHRQPKVIDQWMEWIPLA